MTPVAGLVFWGLGFEKIFKTQGMKGVYLIFLHAYIGGLVVWELAKGTTFLYKKIFVPRTHFPIQILVNFGVGKIWRGIKRYVRRIVDEKDIERLSDNFRRSHDESQSDGKIICLKSYVSMSSKTQIQERGKTQPLKTVELSEYQKIHYKIYMYRPQVCQRQKGCCSNIYVTTLDYTLFLAHGFIFILSGFPIFNRHRCAQIWM